MNDEIKDWNFDVVVEYSPFAHIDVQNAAKYLAANLRCESYPISSLDSLGPIFIKLRMDFVSSGRTIAYQKAIDALEIHYFQDSQGMLHRLTDYLIAELIGLIREEIVKDLGWSHD